MAIFSYFIENIMEVFVDDFSICGTTFDECLANLSKVLQRCKESNLVLNWEKYYFMAREVIVLGRFVSEKGICNILPVRSLYVLLLRWPNVCPEKSGCLELHFGDSE